MQTGNQVQVLKRRIQAQPRDLLLFLATAAFVGASTGMFDTTFNNFLDDAFQISASTRGLLEFPRELPGFLVAMLSGLLIFLSDTKIASVALLTMAVGLLGLAVWSSSFTMVVAAMILASTGSHLYMPVEQSIGVAVASKDKVGQRLGQLAGVRTAATIVGAGIVWLGMDFFGAGYNLIFILAGVLSVIAAILVGSMGRRGERPVRTSRFVFKRKYSIYYWMDVLFGARKQVFITFGPWVLIKVFDQPASIIAQLWIVSSILGVVFKPVLGKLIDSWGERTVLMLDAVVLMFVCLGYGFSESLNLGRLSLWLVYICFVLDQLLFAVGMARTTYLDKIAESREDLMPTISLGITINHAVSMTIPVLGGFVWTAFGYEWVFVGAAAVALINLGVCSQIRIPAPSRQAVSDT